MSCLNESFLETYKRLDKICKEIYRSNKGISNYIDDMKQVPSFECRNIPQWNSTLTALVKLRHIRNQLSHDVGTLSSSICTPSDINWLTDFHTRILSATDPLAILRKQRATQKPIITTSNKGNSHSTSSTNKIFQLQMFIVILLLLLIALTLIYIFSII